MHELYWQGAFDEPDQQSLPGAVQAAWDNLIAERASALETSYGSGVPPRPEDWPGYSLTRSRTLRAIAKLAETRTGRRGSRPKPELELEDPSTGLYGTLDRIEVTGGKITVVDLKSGVWQREMTDDQRRQLLLYAALVRANYGSWPEEVVIETAAGRQTTLPVDPQEALLLVDQAIKAVAAFNETSNAGWAALEQAARPSDETCRHCPARLRCGPYWRALSREWSHHGAVAGDVTSATFSQDGFATVTIETVSPIDRRGELTFVYGVRSGVAPAAESVGVVGSDERGDDGVLRCRWDTEVEFRDRSYWQGLVEARSGVPDA